MKKIIDGLLYDTDKATLVWQEDKFRKRNLYFRTEKGNYFVLYSSKVIQPITEEKFKEILGEADPDRYIELFDNIDNA